jgi:hypothetical protein
MKHFVRVTTVAIALLFILGCDDKAPAEPVEVTTIISANMEYKESVSRFLNGAFRVEYQAYRETPDDGRTEGRVTLFKDGLATQRVVFVGRGIAGEFERAEVFTLTSPAEPIVCSDEFVEPMFSPVAGTDGCVTDEPELAGILLARFGFSLGYEPVAQVPRDVVVRQAPSRSIANRDSVCFMLEADQDSSEICFGDDGAPLFSSFTGDSERWELLAVETGAALQEHFALPKVESPVSNGGQ